MTGIFFDDYERSFVPHILKEIYIDRVYEPFLEFRADLTIVDLGANVGLTAAYFSRFAKRVIAVEPSEQHRRCIEKMLAFNRIGNVDVYGYAVAGENGTARLHHPEGNVTMFSTQDAFANAADGEAVETVTLEHLFDVAGIEHVDFLKMDIEGAEGEVVLSGGFRAVAERIDCIVGEWHEWCPNSPFAVMKALRDAGFANGGWLPEQGPSMFAVWR